MIEIVIFDWKRTLYDPEKKSLISGTTDVLQYLGASGIKLYLVGKDPANEMADESERLGVSDFFTAVHFVTGPKTDEDLGQFIDPDKPNHTAVIGDRVRSEITVGNRLGAQTIWIQNGKFAAETPETPEQNPDYTITDISELPDLFDSIQ
jgi:FMN phosphatase YigB (HAD superfamily)